MAAKRYEPAEASEENSNTIQANVQSLTKSKEILDNQQTLE